MFSVFSPLCDTFLLIRSSPLFLLPREALSGLHLHCSLSLWLIFGSSLRFSGSFLQLLLFLRFDDGWCFIGYLRGSGGLLLLAGPEDRGRSQTFLMRRSLNSSRETNEDEFGGWMYVCIKGVLGLICSSVTPKWSCIVFFAMSLVFLFSFQIHSNKATNCQYQTVWDVVTSSSSGAELLRSNTSHSKVPKLFSDPLVVPVHRLVVAGILRSKCYPSLGW